MAKDNAKLDNLVQTKVEQAVHKALKTFPLKEQKENEVLLPLEKNYIAFDSDLSGHFYGLVDLGRMIETDTVELGIFLKTRTSIRKYMSISFHGIQEDPMKSTGEIYAPLGVRIVLRQSSGDPAGVWYFCYVR